MQVLALGLQALLLQLQRQHALGLGDLVRLVVDHPIFIPAWTSASEFCAACPSSSIEWFLCPFGRASDFVSSTPSSRRDHGANIMKMAWAPDHLISTQFRTPRRERASSPRPAPVHPSSSWRWRACGPHHLPPPWGRRRVPLRVVSTFFSSHSCQLTSRRTRPCTFVKSPVGHAVRRLDFVAVIRVLQLMGQYVLVVAWF